MSTDPTPADALPDHIRVPHPDRLSPARPDYGLILAVHAEACLRDDDGYLDPATGNWVFTATYLEERGFCCERGCRHCPWVERP